MTTAVSNPSTPDTSTPDLLPIHKLRIAFHSPHQDTEAMKPTNPLIATKAEVLLKLALGYHESNPEIPDSQERVRKSFKAVIAALRKLGSIPAADIDEFVKSVKCDDGVEALAAPAALFADEISDEELYSALCGSGMFDDMPKDPIVELGHHPSFTQAMARIGALHEKHGPHAAEQLPECKALWEQVWEHAPPEFMQLLRDGAKEFGLLPETRYVNDAGEPVFSAEQIAEKLGLPVEEVDKQIREKFGDRLEVGNVHPLQ